MQAPQPTRSYSHLLAGILNALCGLLWTTAYVLYVFQARLDSSYGMPVVALIMNLSWEFVHTFVYPVHGVGRFFHFPWVFIDGLLLVETLKYGPQQWHAVPLVADNFVPLVVLGLVLCISGQWAFTSQFSDLNSSFWSAYVCQNVLSWGSLWMLLSRGNTSGHSLHIWSLRFLGSLAANLRYAYRERFWPSKYSFISAPFSRWILWMPFLADLIYPLVFRGIWEREAHFRQPAYRI